MFESTARLKIALFEVRLYKIVISALKIKQNDDYKMTI